MTGADELVEWVDDDDRLIEVVPRSRMRAENLLHRSVAVIVTTTDGRLVVQRRADHKDLFPGWWDIAFGGVCGVGEEWLSSARRELVEEAGIPPGVVNIVTGHGDPCGRALTSLR